MKHMTFTLKASLLGKLLLAAAMMIGGGSSVWGDESSITINDGGSTSFYVPFYSSALNVGNGSGQFIIPRGLIDEDMKEGTIKSMLFEVSAGTTFISAEHCVYLKEVNKTAFSSLEYDDWDAMYEVYSGALAISDSKIEINFASPYVYHGGDLLIGFKQTKNATSSPSPSIQWKGASVSGNVALGYKFSGLGYTSFLPKMTFTYTPPVTSTLIISPDEDVAFGTVFANATKTDYYTITNNTASTVNVTAAISGTDAASFSVSPSVAHDIASGETQTYSISYIYDSESLGEKAATITFTPDGDGTNAITKNITATAVAANTPELLVTPDESATFGTIRANATKTYTVTNVGTGIMNADIASDNATEFSVSKSSVELGAGESTTFDVTFNFNTSRSGDRSATITVTPTYDEDCAVSISATATAITRPILSISPASAYFGSLKVNASKEITISNTGYGDMEVNINSSNDALFSVTPSSLTVAQDESETFTINFNYDPSNLGYKTAIITVTPTYDEDDEKTVSVNATAIEPLFVSPDSKTSFGNVSGNASRTFTVTNLGGSEMDVTIENSNETFYSLSETSFSDIPAGESRTFTVTFNYDSEVVGSKKSATIRVYPNGQGISHAVTLNIEATPQLSTYADFILDEDSPTEILTGTKKVNLKYSAKSGWNTFCVPFGMNTENMDYVFGSGCKYYTLNSYDTSERELAFTQVNTTLSAGVPVLVYTESAPAYEDGVILTRYIPTSHDAGSASDNGATFQGSYVTKTFNAETDVDAPWFGVTSDGHIMKAGTGAFVRGYRAYLTGVSAPAGGSVKMFIIGGDDIPTDVGFVKMVDADAKEVYNLAGQKVQKGRKGIYIVNGKKVVIK